MCYNARMTDEIKRTTDQVRGKLLEAAGMALDRAHNKDTTIDGIDKCIRAAVTAFEAATKGIINPPVGG